MKDSTIATHFSVIQDPRVTERSKYKLIDYLLLLFICTGICGADDWGSP